MSFAQPKLGPDCQKCPLYAKGIPVMDYVPSSNMWSDVAIVGEMPGANEVRDKMPFVGMSGQLLDSYFKHLMTKRDAFYITNAQRCGLPGGAKLSAKETKIAAGCCRPVLLHNLDQMAPKVVVAMGAVAWESLSGIEKLMPYRGCVLDKETQDDYYVMATFHPAYVLRVPMVTDVVGADLEKALKLARGEIEYYHPQVIPATYENVMKILDDAEAAGYLTVDTETDNIEALDANMKTLGLSVNEVGLSVPWPSVARYYTDEQFEHILNRFRAICQNPEMDLVFHNFAYDVPVLERCL